MFAMNHDKSTRKKGGHPFPFEEEMRRYNENLKRNLQKKLLDREIETGIELIYKNKSQYPNLSQWSKGTIKDTILNMVEKGYGDDPKAVYSAITMLEMDLEHEKLVNS